MISLHELAQRTSPDITNEQIISEALVAGEITLDSLPGLLEDAKELLLLEFTYDGNGEDLDALGVKFQEEMDTTLGPAPTDEEVWLYTATRVLRGFQAMTQLTTLRIEDFSVS